MRRALAYVRQSHSRADQDESVSLAFQEQRIRQHAERNDLDIIAVYSDIDVSGNIESRTGLDAMLERCERGGIDVVAIYNISRLARDSYLFLKICRSLEKRRVVLVSASESMEDKTVTTVLSAFAERERTTLSNNVAYAVREQAQRGLFTQQPPFGYSRTDGVLYPVEPDASIVRRVFREYVEGKSTQQIIDGLTAEHVPSPYGKVHWRGKAIRAMLKRRTYIGEIEISETRDPSGKVRPYLLTRGLHEPLIDPDTWELAQRKLAAAGWSRSTAGRINPWLTGRAFCSVCGRKIYFGVKSRSSSAGEVRWFAKCSTAQLASDARTPNTCAGQQSADLHLLEPIARATLYDHLRRIISPEEAYDAARAQNARRGGDRRVELAARLESAKRESAELLRLKLKDEITDDEWHANRERLEAIIALGTSELDAIPAETPLSSFVRAHARVSDRAELIATMSDDDLRVLLLTLDATATLDLKAKRVDWQFAGEFAALLAD